MARRKLGFAAAAFTAAAVLGSAIGVASSETARPHNSHSSARHQLQAWSQPVSDHGVSGYEIDLNGQRASDQSPPVSTLSHPTPAKAPQKSAFGPNASYPTEYWSTEETDTPNGAFIVTRTAPNTWAVTGVVSDDNTCAPISGATAKVVSSSLNLATTTNADGTFAFVDLPVGSRWAQSYGLFTGRNLRAYP